MTLGKSRVANQLSFADVGILAETIELAQLLDAKLQEINSDYEAKRYKNITLQHLEVIEAREGLFNEWLKQQGKLGGQHKVPRLSNDRKTIDQLITLNKQ